MDLALIAAEGFYSKLPSRERVWWLFWSTAGRINLDRAFALSLSFDGVNTDELHHSIRRVADVFWQLKQDSEVGCMEAKSLC